MSAEIVKAILENVLLNKPHKKLNDLCCVCLQIIESDEKYSIRDEFEFAFDTNSKFVESLGTIMETVIGKSITEVSYLLKCVCLECKDAVMASYKFILGARENVKILSQVIENLQRCFMDIPEPMLWRCKTIYVNIESDEIYSTFRRYYDKKHTDNQKEASERINNIIKHQKSIEQNTLSEDEAVLENDEAIEVIEPSFKESEDSSMLDNQHGNVSKQICQQLTDEIPENKPSITKLYKKRSKLYECPDCKAGFNSLQNYERHRNLKKKCTSKKRGFYECAHCKYNAVYKHMLRYHVEVKHPEKTPNENVVCDKCGEFFRNGRILNAHKLTHKEQKKVECQECGRKLKSLNSLKIHMAVHTGEKNYPCKFCGKRFRNSGNRYDHIQRHHVKSDPIQCTICQRVYKKRQDYLKHVKTHNKSSPRPKSFYQCAHCEYSATQKHLLKNHIQYKHEGTRGIVCDKCGKKFMRQYTLKQHMETHKEWMFQCEVCKKKFKNEISMKNHMANHDNVDYIVEDSLKQARAVIESQKGFKIFNCPDCNAGFQSLELYEKHKSTRKPCAKWKRGNFPCNQCGFSATYKTMLKRHIIQQHLGMGGFTCEICGKICRDLRTFKMHRLSHSEVPTFECKECDRRFRSEQGLKNHLLSHTGEKKYVCNLCDTAFSTPGGRYSHIRRRHRRARTPEKPQRCAECGKVFKCRRTYLKHRKRVHS